VIDVLRGKRSELSEAGPITRQHAAGGDVWKDAMRVFRPGGCDCHVC
jgi:hypothetical protein